MMYRRFDARKGFLSKNSVPTLKHGGDSMMFLACFRPRGSGQLIAVREIIKFDDYIKILDENLLQVGTKSWSSLAIYFPIR